MKERLTLVFQTSSVFIGTIVGAGLASGQEITQFFTSYGYKSFIGILLCLIIYIFIGNLIIKISSKYNLSSYNELIDLVMPGYIGKFTDILTSFFMLTSSSIILAGCGSLLNQYFNISIWVGIIIMVIISLITLLKDTKGIITINSFIVPSLIIIILTLFAIYILTGSQLIDLNYLKSIKTYKKSWIISALLYAGFNILCCSGVLVPLSKEFKDTKSLCLGSSIGAIILTILCMMINLMLLLNIPYIFEYDIPLLYISNRFGKLLQIMLLAIIFCEMFSTEVSDVYSLSKTLKTQFNIPYKKSVVLILLIAIPISQIGFKKLIAFLYPAFGTISIIFMIACVRFYKKKF